MGQLEKSLIDSLHTGFIDKDKMSLEKYRPKLLINNHKEGRKVLSNIINELEHCDEFFFSVAFITYSGVLVLLNTLKELEAKGIKGKQRLGAGEYADLVGAEAVEKQYGLSHELRPKISPNKMQVKALRGIEKVRERGETKALLISATGERVIIVTGCINALRSRVLGTLVNMIHALLRVIRV